MDDIFTEKKKGPFNTFFHQLVGQDSAPDIVQLDHCYARLWNAHPDAAHARPAKMLFMKGIPHYPGIDRQSPAQSIVDVEAVSATDKLVPPFDAVRAKALINECERHVLMNYASDKSDDWEEHIKSYRSGWSANENRLFNKVMKVLQSDRLSRLAYEGTQNEPVNRRLVVNKTASNIRQIFSSVAWDMKQLHWLHQILLEHLSPAYLSAYFDVLQTLKSKVPSLIDKLTACTPNKTAPSNGETLQQLLKRPWDPVATLLSQHKPKKLPGSPLILVTPSGPHSILLNSRRMKFWQSQLSLLSRVITVNPHVTLGTTVAACLQQIVNAVKLKVIELKVGSPNRPIILVGWTVGALIASQVALAEPVSAVVCLGFPLTGVDGSRGNLDDPLLDTQTPTLFVVGQNANTCSVDDIEDFRERMRAESGLVVVGGADDQLRVSHTKKKLEGVTQTMVDRCILNEIAEYLTVVLTDPTFRLPPVMSNLSKVPETTKKRKRKQKDSLPESSAKPKKISASRKGGQNVNISPSSPGSSTTDTSSTGSSIGDAAAKRTIGRKKSKLMGEKPKKRPRLQKSIDDGEKQSTPKQPRQPGRQRKASISSKSLAPEEPKEKSLLFNTPESPKNPRSLSINIGSLSSLSQIKQVQTILDESEASPTIPSISFTGATFTGQSSMTKNVPTAATFSPGNDATKHSSIIHMAATTAGGTLMPTVATPMQQQNRPQLQTLTLRGKTLLTPPRNIPPAAVSKPPTVILNTSPRDNATYVFSSPKTVTTPGGMLQSALLGNRPPMRKLQVITFLKPSAGNQESLSNLKKLAPKLILSPGSEVVTTTQQISEPTTTIKSLPSPSSATVSKSSDNIGVRSQTLLIPSSPMPVKDSNLTPEKITNPTRPNITRVTAKELPLVTSGNVSVPSETASAKELESGGDVNTQITNTLSHLSAGTQEAVLALTQLSAGAQMAVSALAELSAGNPK